jgi:hypothetical protein
LPAGAHTGGAGIQITGNAGAPAGKAGISTGEAGNATGVAGKITRTHAGEAGAEARIVCSWAAVDRVLADDVVGRQDSFYTAHTTAILRTIVQRIPLFRIVGKVVNFRG